MRREDAVMLSQKPSLRRYFALYVLTVGRRLLAMRQTLVLVEAHNGPDALRANLVQLIKYDEGLVGRENLWRQQRKSSKARPDAKQVDGSVDKQLGSIFTTTDKFLAGLDPEADKDFIVQGQKMLAELFPEGVGAITNLPYEDELEAVRYILSELGGTWKSTVAELGLNRHVARLHTLTDDYEAALGKLPQTLVDFKVLRAERWLGHELMLSVVSQILSAYGDLNPATIDTREAVMLPINTQNLRIADYLKRRQRISDVNPDTGEELEPDPLSEPLENDETI